MNKFISSTVMLITSIFYNNVQADDLVTILDNAQQSYLIEDYQSFKEQQINLPKTLLYLFPTVDLNYSTNINSISESSGNSITSDGKSNSLSLSITQPILSLSAFYEISTAKHNDKINLINYENAKQLLIFKVIDLYFNVLAAEEELFIAKSLENSNEEKYKQISTKYDVGIVDKTSVLEAKYAYDSSITDRISYQHKLTNSLNELNELTGNEYISLKKLKDNFTILPPNPNQVESWINYGVSNNPDILSAYYSSEASMQRKNSTYDKFIPSIYGKINFIKNDNPKYQNTYTQSNITLTWNIFNSGKDLLNRKQSTHNYKKSLARLDKTRKKVINEIKSTFNHILLHMELINSAKNAIESAKSAYESIVTQEKMGKRTTLDVLHARNNVYKSEQMLTINKYAYIKYSAKLRLITGQLTREDLLIINKLLN